MKTIITTVFAFIIYTGYTQPYAVPSIGKSDLNYLAGLSIGYEFKNVIAEGYMLFHLDRVNAAYLGAAVGYNVPIGMFTLTPLIGRNYRLISTDKKSLNGWVWSGGFRLEYSHVTLSLIRMDEVNFCTVGFRGLLTKKYK